jgi:hypothetical protein
MERIRTFSCLNFVGIFVVSFVETTTKEPAFVASGRHRQSSRQRRGMADMLNLAAFGSGADRVMKTPKTLDSPSFDLLMGLSHGKIDPLCAKSIENGPHVTLR